MKSNLTEWWDELYKTPTTEPEKREELSFKIIRFYCAQKKGERGKEENFTAVCGAAAALSGIVKKGLSGPVLRLLEKNETKLPAQAAQVLRGNLMRMEGH